MLQMDWSEQIVYGQDRLYYGLPNMSVEQMDGEEGCCVDHVRDFMWCSETENGACLQLSQTSIQGKPCFPCCNVQHAYQSGQCQQADHSSHI